MRKLSLRGLAVIAAWLLSVTLTHAVPADISWAQTRPRDDSTLFVARTAANDPLGIPTFQLKADVFISNSGSIGREVSLVKVSYPGSSITNRNYVPRTFVTDDMGTTDTADDVTSAVPYVMLGNDTGLLPIFDGLERDLSPLPPSVRIEIYFVNDSDPLVLNYDLAFYENATPTGSYFFPTKDGDLPAGQYWSYGTRHVVDSGGGVNGIPNPTADSQKYAMDVSVVRWNGSAWTTLVDGAPAENRANSDFLSWAMPLYAMSDGEVVSCFRGEQDHAPGGFGDITFSNTFGNSVSIRTGNEVQAFAHFMFGTIPMELCPSPGQNNNLSIPVEAGQFLGLVGNTGRSTAPHIHFQVNARSESGPNTLGGVPMNFHNVRVLASQVDVSNLGESPDLKPMHGLAYHRHMLTRPNPCGFDLPEAGFIEYSRHGVEAECHQDVFNLAVMRGYRPVFVDGFDVDGDTYFNSTFRTGGPSWGARHGMSGGQYQDYFNSMTAAGFRPLQVDSYLENGNTRYAAIFDARQGPNWGAFHGLTDLEYGDRVDAFNTAGYVPVDVSTVEVGGTRYWTGIFERDDVADWAVESVRASDFQDTFDGHIDAGRIPFFVHGYSDLGMPWITGIWIEPVGNTWGASHGLDKNAYQDMWDANTASGRLTRYASGYDNGAGSMNYAALWRSRPSTNLHTFPPPATNQTSATFDYEASVPFASFRCALDGGSFAPCTAPRTYINVAEGVHTFRVAAVDRESVSDPTPSSYTWIADYTPPEVALVTPPEFGYILNGRLTPELRITRTIEGWGDIVATAVDELAGVDHIAFAVDGIPLPAADVALDEAGTWSFRFEPERTGYRTYTVSFTATDKAGNSASTSFEILGVPAPRKDHTRQPQEAGGRTTRAPRQGMEVVPR